MHDPVLTHATVMHVHACYAPMTAGVDYVVMGERPTIADAVAEGIRADHLPRSFWWRGHASILDQKVDREKWHATRPKPGAKVFLWVPVADPLSLTSALGLFAFNLGAPVALANAITFGAGSLLAAGVGLAGQLALNSLFAPSTASADEGDVAQVNRASITQNIPRKGQPYPFVFGTARVAPQPLCYPLTFQQGDDVYVEQVLALAGPHSMSDVRVKGVPITGNDNIETWIEDGTAAARTNYFTKYGFTERLGKELPPHRIRMGETGYVDRELVDQVTPENSLPDWITFKTRQNADYADLKLLIRNPFDAGEGLVKQVFWFRLKARKVGETNWKNIGTVPYIAKGQGDFSRIVRFYFSAFPNTVSDVTKSENGFLKPATLPVVDVDHVNFKTTDSDRFPEAYSYVWRLQREGIHVWLTDSYFTAADQEYEFAIQRSEMVEYSNLGSSDANAQTMLVGGNYYDFCDARWDNSVTPNVWRVQENTDDQGDQIYLDSITSVKQESPVPNLAEVATLHIRAKNTDLSEITVLASALVPTWNGSAFTGQSASSNPADHYRNLHVGDNTIEPIGTAYMDDETLGEWWDECDARGYEINMAYYGSQGEAREIIATCGFARAIEGQTFSVAYYHDTSAERAVRLFTPRNSADLSWTVPFSRRPAAFLCSFKNAARNFEDDQITVNDPYPLAGSTGDYEELSYPGLTTEAQVTARAQFDFLQARRGTRYSFRIGFDWVSPETRPGNVVMLSHDALHSQAAWARVSSIISGTVIKLDMDAGYAAPTSFFELANVFDSENVFAEGEPWGVAVQAQTDGEVRVHPVEGYSSSNKYLSVPDTTGIAAGDLVAIGPTVQSLERLLIVDVTPEGGDTARVVCQEEGYDWPLGYGSIEGQLLDSLVLETDGLALGFTTGKGLVRDTGTVANAFHGDLNDLLTYASPSTKYVRDVSGALVAGTTLRIDYDKDAVALGVRLEGEDTNNATYSIDLTGADWSWEDAGTITAGDAFLVDGETFWTIESNSTSTDRRQNFTVTADARQNASVFVKAGNQDNAKLTIAILGGSPANTTCLVEVDTSDGSVSTGTTGGAMTINDAGAVDYGNGIYRLWIDYTPSSGGTSLFALLHDGMTGGDSAQYAQFEHHYGAWRDGSIIVTEASPVTRNADDVSLATSAFPWLATAGSLTVKARPGIANELGAAVSVNDGSGDEEIVLYRDASGNLVMQVENGGANQLAPLDTGQNAADQTQFAMAAAWTADDFALAADAGSAQTDSSGTLPAVDTMQIGRNQAGDVFNGHLASVVYRPRRVTNAELAAEVD